MSDHEATYIGTTRGRRRTTFYGYCSCGRGTTSSATVKNVKRKLRDHANGDDSGMYRRAR